ncbi:thioesterase family protein [Nocardioides sp.]|uniref:thioesterase family protein n=1 Tax=Nocardioides sp. TaxID=35761 RepID=UPI002726B171|nr:thioesterase family protein [Nocardioides sp.]MDO9458311.1 thioesterase family protein [Nocardioides sp.]
MPYFDRIDERTFTPTEHVGGAWNLDEQHVGPSLGLLCHLVERDHAERRGDRAGRLDVTRLSYDILGTLTMDPFTVDVDVRRAGRTIELVEATVTQAGRAAVVLRAWLVQPGDTTSYAGTGLAPIAPPGTMGAWDPTALWAGGFIASAEVRRLQESPGRGAYWVRTVVPLLDEPISPTAAAAGLADIANGMTVRADPAEVVFPNVDLTAHLFRPPSAGWLGFDTTVSFGAGGHGLTSSTLHDESGPFGTLAQVLTVRPRPDARAGHSA